MALRFGTRNDASSAGAGQGSALGRLLGFVALTAVATGLFGAMVLVPPYADLKQTEYRRAGLAAENADATARIASNERRLAAAESDPVLTKRLAMQQLGLYPRDEAVVVDPGAPVSSPQLVSIPRHPKPDAPPAWLPAAAAKLRRPGTRRGLALLAAGALAATMFLFPSRSRQAAAP